MDAAAYIESDRTFVPLRYAAYAAGVSADNILYANGKVTIIKGDKVVQLTIGANTLVINGITITTCQGDGSLTRFSPLHYPSSVKFYRVEVNGARGRPEAEAVNVSVHRGHVDHIENACGAVVAGKAEGGDGVPNHELCSQSRVGHVAGGAAGGNSMRK